jgi:hypothetical protein
MTLSAGTRLGPYEILSPLGAGGMGEVYKARDPRLGRDVAIKVLPASFSEDSDRLRRFEQEARSASALNHPNIITIHEIGSADSTSYIAMECVDGESLRELLASGALATKKMLDVAVQIGEGLAKAHAAGIVHRDLKPENVMVSKDGFVKLLDFGLAKLFTAPQEQGSGMPTMVHQETQPGTVMGTVGYMSPEQASGRPIDFRSDQFAFGSILYEMATGKRAFQRETGAETLTAIIKDEPEPVERLNPKAPAPFRWIVERCLAKDSRDRYASTLDLARDLRTVREHLTELSGSGAAGTVEAAPRRRPGWIAVAAAFLIGAAVSAVWLRGPAASPAHTAPVVRPLTYTGRDYSPAASPDGKTIAFASDRDGKKRVWLKQVAGGGEQALTDGPQDDFPRFSPDGAAVLFVRMAPGQPPAVYRQDLVGGEVRRISENAVSADWSPDGKSASAIRSLARGAGRIGAEAHRAGPRSARESPFRAGRQADRSVYLGAGRGAVLPRHAQSGGQGDRSCRREQRGRGLVGRLVRRRSTGVLESSLGLRRRRGSGGTDRAPRLEERLF